MLPFLFWSVLSSSLYAVALIVLWLTCVLLAVAFLKNNILAIGFFSTFFAKADALVICPITSVVTAYVIPGVEPFFHFFCHEGATEVWHIRGQQWYWQYSKASLIWEEFLLFRQQTDGQFLQQSTFPCFISAHRPVMVMGDALDVIHSWSVPDLGVKMDVIPGHITLDTFLPCLSGFFTGACYEICGAYHALMAINVVVI
uniref:cytochrome-c oxidase n=1 Tax=Kudoa septempunctata TaxID=751907 RepID=A0A0H5BIB6_9CNID|nr:cytochrome c oxidase subunit II [Kudoa septempunctata]BAR94679.1 cytochrome c oxidase subunit II [Kudoa septempunctata]